MMYNQKSKARRRVRALALVPAVVAALAVVNIPAVADAMSMASSAKMAEESKPTIKIMNNSSIVQVSDDKSNEPVEVVAAASLKKGTEGPDVPAEFPGGIYKMFEFLMKTLKYPDAAEKESREGRVLVKFVVKADGSIENPEIAESVCKDLDEEALRVVKLMPKWTPAKSDGKAVDCNFVLPISFKLPKESGKKSKVEEKTKSTTVDLNKDDNVPVYVDGKLFKGGLKDIDKDKIESVTVKNDPDRIYVVLKK